MDNKKLLIIFVPVVVLVFGYVIYTDYLGKDDSKGKKQEEGNFVDVDAKRDTLKKSKRERYKEKWEKENELSRHIDNDDDFFGKEIKGDSVIDESAEKKKKAKRIDYTEPLTASPAKKEEKQKVVYVYKEAPQKKDNSVVESQAKEGQKESAVVTQPVSRRKLGFSTIEAQSSAKEITAVGGSGSVAPINAVIQDESTVKSGSNVLIRIVDEVTIGGRKIPKNTLAYGLCSFTNERIKIEVNSIQVGSNTINEKLRAFDMDGNEGLLVQGGIEQQVKKDVLNDAVSQVNTVVRVPILRTVPSSAGNRTVNAPSIQLPKGHKLTLRL